MTGKVCSGDRLQVRRMLGMCEVGAKGAGSSCGIAGWGCDKSLECSPSPLFLLLSFPLPFYRPTLSSSLHSGVNELFITCLVFARHCEYTHHRFYPQELIYNLMGRQVRKQRIRNTRADNGFFAFKAGGLGSLWWGFTKLAMSTVHGSQAPRKSWLLLFWSLVSLSWWTKSCGHIAEERGVLQEVRKGFPSGGNQSRCGRKSGSPLTGEGTWGSQPRNRRLDTAFREWQGTVRQRREGNKDKNKTGMRSDFNGLCGLRNNGGF